MKKQNGNAALFVLVCLPLVLSFTVLVIDVSRYQSSREQAQEYVDEIVLHAAKFLPNADVARSYIENKINVQNIYVIKNLEINTETVYLTLGAEVDSLFDVFLAAFTGRSQNFTVNQHAVATIAPVDLVLIIPDGISMRPLVKNYWGDWPTSTYFNLVISPQVLEQADLGKHVWPLWWNDFSNYSKWATQSCFNPVFSSVKSFAISLIDSYAKLSASRLAVITAPGEDSLLGHSLVLSTSGELYENRLNYWEEENYLSDELCVFIASQNDFYKILSNNSCPELLISQISKQLYYPRGMLSDCVKQGNLSAQEAIYYSSATKFSNSETSVLSALRSALAQIAINPSAGILESRANLSLLAKKEVLLVIDQPVLSASALTQLWGNLDVGLTIAPFYSSEDRKNLDDFVRDLRDLNLPNLRVYNPVEPESLIEKVLPEIMQSNQQVLLRS